MCPIALHWHLRAGHPSLLGIRTRPILVSPVRTRIAGDARDSSSTSTRLSAPITLSPGDTGSSASGTSHSLSMTGSATTTFVLPICIEQIVWMAIRTFIFRQIPFGKHPATDQIRQPSHGFEMRRVHVARVPTQMVNDTVGRNRAHPEFIGNAMGVTILAVHPKLAVAIANARGRPLPAGQCAVGLMDLRKKALFKAHDR